MRTRQLKGVVDNEAGFSALRHKPTHLKKEGKRKENTKDEEVNSNGVSAGDTRADDASVGGWH